VSLLDMEGLGGRFAVLVPARATFFKTGLLARTLRAGLETLRAGRILRAADFLAEVFFLVCFAIACKARSTHGAGKTEA
jgi:hypothetical protein